MILGSFVISNFSFLLLRSIGCFIMESLNRHLGFNCATSTCSIIALWNVFMVLHMNDLGWEMLKKDRYL